MPDLRDLLPHSRTDSEQNVILALMIRQGNQADLARLCGISQPSVTTALKKLEALGIVRRTEEGREKLSRLERANGVAVGVELGRQRSAVVARRIDSPQENPAREMLKFGAKDGSESWSTKIVEEIRYVVDQLNESFDDVATVGLAIPRMVHPITGRLTPPMLPPWTQDADPARMLRDRLRAGAPDGSLRADVEVKLDNDANLGALAESVHASPGAEILLFVKSSTGVGAGLVVGGKVIRGASGVAAELGHLVVERHGDYCQCGGRGCLETVIGADALLRNVETALGKSPPAKPRDLDELVRQALAGDQLCRRVLSEAAMALGLALGSVCNLLNPNVIVLGGGLAAAGDLVLDNCRASIRRTALAAAVDSGAFELRASRLDHPAALGALIMGIQGTFGRRV
ncbi:MAG TPA: ROK family protein [Streptosporangiaceae bacterium]|nr:ROK family protein [Streptosporangiaceae bacterium]